MKTLTKEQEKSLIENAKNDINAFGKLYEYYFDKLYGYVAYMIGNNQNAEDIVSETFEKALNNIDRFEWQGYRFGSWLYRIARNLIYDKSKAKKKLSLDELGEFIQISESNPEIEGETDIAINKLKQAIADLSDDQREIIVLRYIEQYTIKETCEITGRSIDSVKSLAKRAMKDLKKHNL